MHIASTADTIGVSNRFRSTANRIAEALYLFAIVLQAFCNVALDATFFDALSTAFFDPVFVRTIVQNYLPCILFVIFLLNAFCHGVSLPQVCFSFIFCFLVQNIQILFPDHVSIWFFMFIIAFPRELDLRIVARTIWISSAAIIVITIALSLLGFLPDETQLQHGVLRHSLGFVSANSMSFNVTYALLAWMYDFFPRWKLWYTLPAIFVLLSAFVIGNGRVAFIVGIVGLCLLNFSILSSKFRRVEMVALKHVLPWLFFALCFVALLLTIIYSADQNNALLQALDRVLTGRLSFCSAGYTEYGFHLQGQYIKLVPMKESLATGVSWFGIDNAYVLITLKYGIFFTLALGVLYTWFAKRLCNTNDLAMMVLLLLILLIAFTENGMLLPQLNLTIFAIGKMLAAECSSMKCRGGGIKS